MQSMMSNRTHDDKTSVNQQPGSIIVVYWRFGVWATSVTHKIDIYLCGEAAGVAAAGGRHAAAAAALDGRD